MKEARHIGGVNIESFHLDIVQERSKLIYDDGNQGSGYLWRSNGLKLGHTEALEIMKYSKPSFSC